jgi:asparagine synthase (glutamine-hydrolysing)
MGFECPIDHWLRNELKEMTFDTLMSKRSIQRGLFEPDYVGSLLEQHVGGSGRHHHRIYALLNLELWFRAWIDTPVSTVD